MTCRRARRIPSSRLPRPTPRSRAAASRRAWAAARSRASRSRARRSDSERRVAKVRDHGTVVARPDVTIRDAVDVLVDERGTRHDVVEPPADVALAHVAPRCPPREQPIVVGIDPVSYTHLTL